MPQLAKQLQYNISSLKHNVADCWQIQHIVRIRQFSHNHFKKHYKKWIYLVILDKTYLSLLLLHFQAMTKFIVSYLSY